jgi:hypothetical protein
MIETNDPNNRLGWTSYNAGDVGYNGTCWANILSDNLESQYNYMEGCGLTLVDNSVGISVNYKKMVYYKKGNETSGEPLILSNYSKKENASIGLYPNPLKQGETLRIQTNNFKVQNITIYNATGNRVLESTSFENEIETVDVSQLQPGFYIIQLANNNNEFISSKFILK